MAIRSRFLLALTGGILLVLVTAWVGRADAVDLQNIQDSAVLPAGELTRPIGQSFVARTPNLHAIEVRWVVSPNFSFDPQSRVTLHLRGSPQDPADISTVSIPLSQARNNEFSRFEFPAVGDSESRSLYFFLDLSQAKITSGSLSLWSSAEDDYGDGQMYWEGVATDRDLVFRLYYQPDAGMVAQALTAALARYGWGALAALFIFAIFGLALVRARPDLGTLVLASGTGLALVSALSIALLIVRLPDRAVLFALATAAALVVLFRNRSARAISFSTSDILVGGLALVSFGIGLIQIHDLNVPLWMDSYAHMSMIQTLLGEGRFPAAAFYHMGYHLVVASVVQLTGLSIPHAMLLMGQLLITQTGLSLFVLTRRLTSSNAAGLASAICVWFLSPTPSYFITWGRYPLLLGGALLPLALFYAVEWMEGERQDRWAFCLAALTLFGLACAHIRLVVFYGLFIAAYALKGEWRVRARQWNQIGVMAGAGIVFGIGWLAVLALRGLTPEAILARGTAAVAIDLSTATAIVVSHHGIEFVLLASAGVVVGLFRRMPISFVVLTWYVVLFVISLLPFAGAFISPDLVVLMGYLGAALLVGIAVGWVYREMASLGAAGQALIALTVAGVVILAGCDTLSIVNPATMLYSDADQQAMGWIKEYVPPDDKFLVNSFAWTERVYMPSDGGGWIPWLTEHPIEYLRSPLSSETRAEVIAGESAQVQYVYLGWRAGLLLRADFACHPDRYTPVYHNRGIDIYRVKQPGESSEPIKPQGDQCATQG